MLLPIPTPIESIDKATPKNIASFQSIVFELSKSDDFGSRIIFIVIPKNFIKKLYILGSVLVNNVVFLLSFFIA